MLPPETEQKLIKFVAGFRHDPQGFSKYMYQWGKGDLKDSTGPRVWQDEVNQTIGKHLQNPDTRFKPLLLAIASGHGIGKANQINMLVETPSGVRVWGDLQKGDFVFGADGHPVEITHINKFSNIPFYRVRFDDGSYSDVSSGHLWNVRGRQERRNNLSTWRTLETIEILEIGVKRPNGTTLAKQWEIPIQGPAQFEEREIDIHPYLMGVWLGDGSRGQPTYGKPHREIKEKIESLGYEINTANDGVQQRIQNCAHLFRGGIFDCYSYEKYIPDDYKYNTVQNRKALLEGLCDTDGEVHASGSIGYSTTSRRLAEDVVWLTRSLGGKAAIQPPVKKGWYPDENGDRVECRDCYRVTINVPFNPFTIKHRKERYKPSEHRYLTRWIESIEPIPNADGMCITVSSDDHLYLANDFIVTHNSAEISMIINWAMSTCPDCMVVVTANTEGQLRSKTWPEVCRWFRRAHNAHWFKPTATAVYSTTEGHDRTWRADAIPWSENNTEAFAGLHNKGKRILLVFDEGSAISDKVYEVAEGALTDEDTEIIWIVFGNPTRNTGKFRELFGAQQHRWVTKQIDSRKVEGTNKELLGEWVDAYGEDSDFVRVRVRGEFPRAGSLQFMPSDLVEAARKRMPEAKLSDPLIMGVDVARFGEDASVICLRRGRDAKSVPWIKLRGADTMTVAAKVMEMANEYKPDAIFVDGGGVGGGVIDRLNMFKYPVIEVQFGGGADRGLQAAEGQVKYANKRAEMWGYMRDWMKGGMIPDDPGLAAELIGVEYGYKIQGGLDVIILEKKSDMKKRGLASPDEADALALTFAYPVMPSDHSGALMGGGQHRSEYNPLSREHIAQDRSEGYNPLKR